MMISDFFEDFYKWGPIMLKQGISMGAYIRGGLYTRLYSKSNVGLRLRLLQASEWVEY